MRLKFRSLLFESYIYLGGSQVVVKHITSRGRITNEISERA